MKLKGTKDEMDKIYEQLMKAEAFTDDGRRSKPGSSYDQGVIDTINWLLGNDSKKPMSD